MEKCVRQTDRQKIDSLLSHYMNVYHVKIAYYFDVKPGSGSTTKSPTGPYNLSANASTATTFVFEEEPGAYQACLGPGDVKTGSEGVDLKLVFPDQEEFILEEMGLPFVSSVILIVIVMIMSWKTILSLMREKKLSEHTSDFLNNMTHEFKTPLTNIALAGKMMTKDANINDELKIKHYSGIILEENEKLRLQVEQVLSMTALERGEIPLQKMELDLHQLIQDSLKCISVQIENTNGHVELLLNAERVIISADKTHLTNAFCNLVDNAIKYSDEAPQISIQTSNSIEGINVQISDQGIGIEDKYLRDVFNKFFRVPTGNVHDVKGFGLGLSYVKAIIELHGGNISVSSRRGFGTTFSIYLPHAH
jgi:two-component system phosphate regulon sensor histidine kinase PhoR